MNVFARTGRVLGFAVVFTPLVASAQSGSAQGSADIELGANQPSEIEMSAGSAGNADADSSPSRASVRSGGGSDLRLGLQVRLDAVNSLGFAEPDELPGGLSNRLLVPIVTPGVRLLDDHALFLGLGFGFSGFDTDAGPGDSTSQSGFSLSPLVGYDVLNGDDAALSLLGWFNLGSLSDTETCGGGPGGDTCVEGDDGLFGIGLSLAAGIRAKLAEGLALGGEFGWGFLSLSGEGDNDTFAHAVFGNLFLEASIGL